MDIYDPTCPSYGFSLEPYKNYSQRYRVILGKFVANSVKVGKDGIQGAKDYIMENVPKFAGDIKETSAEIIDGVVSTVKDAAVGSMNVAAQVAGGLTNHTMETVSNVIGKAPVIVDAVKDAATTSFNAASTVVGGIASDIATGTRETVSKVAETAPMVADAVKDVTLETLKKAGGVVEGLLTGFAGMAQGVKSVFTSKESSSTEESRG